MAFKSAETIFLQCTGTICCHKLYCDFLANEKVLGQFAVGWRIALKRAKLGCSLYHLKDVVMQLKTAIRYIHITFLKNYWRTWGPVSKYIIPLHSYRLFCQTKILNNYHFVSICRALEPKHVQGPGNMSGPFKCALKFHLNGPQCIIVVCYKFYKYQVRNGYVSILQILLQK